MRYSNPAQAQNWSKPAELVWVSEKVVMGSLPMPGRADFEPLDQWIKGLQKSFIILQRPPRERNSEE